MPLLKINNLGLQNVNFDLEPCDLPPEVFTYGTNYRLLNNKIKSSNMSKTLATPPANFKAGLIMSVNVASGNFYVLLGQSAAWVYNGSAWTAITSSTGYPGISTNGELYWHGCMLGSIPIVNNRQHYPEYWSPQQTSQKLQPLNFGSSSTLSITNYIGAGTTTVTGTVASTYGYSIGDTLTISGATGTEQTKLNGVWLIANVPTSTTFTFVVTVSVAAGTLTTTLGTTTKSGQTWQSKGYSANIIRSHKEFLFALNLSEGGTTLSSTYRWSHPADVNGLPYTWDETDLASIAGKASIGGDMGALVDGKTLRDAFVLYSERGINILNYVGGEFVWQRQVLTSNHGLLAKNCLAEANGVHYFLSDGDILSNDGNSIQSILNKQLKTRLTTNIDSTYYANSFALTNPITKEIWFCVPEVGNTLPNIAFIFNYVDGTTSIRNIPNTTTGLAFGVNLAVPLLWSNTSETWDTSSRVWTYDPTSVFSKTVVSTNNVNSAIVSLELDDNTTVQNTLLERLSFALEGQEVVTTTQSVYPHLTSNESVSIQLGSQDFVGGAVRWKPEVLFNPKTMRKVDIRTTGKLLSWRIKSTGLLPFTLSGLDIEYVINGVR